MLIIEKLPTRYSEGSASVVANEVTVTPTDALWYGNVWGDDLFFDPAQPLVPPQRIETVNEDGTLTLAYPWPGDTMTEAPYEVRYIGIIERSTAQTRRVIEELGKISPYYDVQVDTLADRDDYDDRPTGFAVLVADTGDGRSAIYSKASATSGDWSDPAYVTGPAVTLDVGSVTPVAFGEDPDVTLNPVAGGYELDFDLPENATFQSGTITTLPPGSNATFSLSPVTGGYSLNLGVPRGPTGDINGVTSFWQGRITVDTTAAGARAGLGAERIPLLSDRGVVDFNDIVEPGWQGIVSSASPNAPPYEGTGTQYYYVQVAAFTSGPSRLQIAWPYLATSESDSLCFRQRSIGGSWSSWRILQDRAALDERYSTSGGSVSRNRVVNPSFQISQENGSTAVTANSAYPADQWQLLHDSDGAVSAQRVAVRTPDGAVDRLRVSVVTADASLSGAQHLAVTQKLEGSRVADFLYGTADARPGVLRFGLKAPAGTYCVSIRNAAADRSFVSAVTIEAGEANTDVVKEISFAGDVSGTWPNGNVFGWSLTVCLSAGPTLQGSEGWQGANVLATSAQTNGLASTSNVFELFDFGLKLDPDQSGTYGSFEVPDEQAEFATCQYYFVILNATTSGWRMATGLVNGPNGSQVQMPAPRQRVKAPIITYNDVNEVSGGANHVVNSIEGQFNGSMLEMQVFSSGLTTGQTSQLRWDSGSGWMKLNARM